MQLGPEVVQLDSDRRFRHRVAEERTRAWARMGQLCHSASTPVEDEERRLLGDKVTTLTTILNGHAHDIWGLRPPYYSTGGLYEDKRLDRVAVMNELKDRG